MLCVFLPLPKKEKDEWELLGLRKAMPFAVASQSEKQGAQIFPRDQREGGARRLQGPQRWSRPAPCVTGGETEAQEGKSRHRAVSFHRGARTAARRLCVLSASAGRTD